MTLERSTAAGGKRLPPFKSIEAFIAVAQTLSFTRAATSLHITAPAVCRRIQALEADLGTLLFQRTRRALKLTPPGEAFRAHLGTAIESIYGAAERVRAKGRAHVLRISVPSSFAANWLAPRLSRFDARRRGVHLELDTSDGFADFEQSDADLVIRRGTGNWPGVRAQLVVPVRSYPVCSDEFLARHSPLGSPRDLLRLPLLGFTPQPDLWSKWLGAAGIGQVPKPSYMFDDLNVLCQAAANGLGMAIGLDVVIEPYLQNSQLVRPFADPVTLPKGYYMIARTPDWTRRPVSTFREWLLAEAGAWREIAGGGLLPAPAATAHRA